MALTSELLAAMEDLDDVLSNADISGTAGAIQTRALRALNRSQDFLEHIIGAERDLLSTVDDTISQTVGQEYTALPSRTVRIDAVWFLDATNSRPQYEIDAERVPSGHRQRHPVPLFDVSTSANSTGKPRRYWYSRRDSRLYWDRDPDTTNSIRVVGFFGAADMTETPDTTFAYDDSLIMPVAAVAGEIFKFRRRDNWEEHRQYANSVFQPVVQQMIRGWRHQQGAIRGSSFPSW